MKQVLVKGGQIVVEDIPAPKVEVDSVLVDVSHSCISAGTELSSIKQASIPLYKKALQRPDLVKKAVKMVAETGLRRTMDVAKGKIEAGNPTGYSAAGTVIEVGENIKDITVGERVACAGAGIANHADIISVPRNLLTKIPEDVSFPDASTVTLGAIAMQGVRRAEPTLGETFVVIGLGILGQIAFQLLKASGVRVIGFDLDDSRLKLAEELGIDEAIFSDESDPISRIARLTDGVGADGVIITAAGASHEIISNAFQMCRRKGRVVLVGDVGLNIKREDIYQKELDFFISTSYGPGRYDDRYEQKGLDYPIGYVRWTENRNMAEYLRLIDEKRINIEALVSEVFKVEDASIAYESLKKSENRPLIVLLSYESSKKEESRVINVNSVKNKEGVINIAVIGAGGFAKGMHIPNIKKIGGAKIKAIVSRTGSNAVALAKQVEAAVATTDCNDVLNDPDIDAVIITTRHDLHAEMTIDALKAGKHVLVEKPLALNREQLMKIISTYEEMPAENRPVLTVGFNRRFSKYAVAIKKALDGRTAPFIATYRMNAGYIPKDHWVHSSEGGGRNIGEGCHIYDLFDYFTDSKVEKISATSITSKGEQYLRNDNFSATIRYVDGSLCNLIYTALGNSELDKERLEVFVDGKVLTLNDYKSSSFIGSGDKELSSNMSEKGQLEEMKAFIASINNGSLPIPFWQLVQATEISFEVEEQITS